MPRGEISDWLDTLAGALPFTYAYDALARVSGGQSFSGKLVLDVGVVIGATLLSLALAAATLRRRTACPNGAGKTTIRTLVDLLHPTSGSARLFGLNSRRDSVAIRRRQSFRMTSAGLLAVIGGRLFERRDLAV